MTVFDGLVMQQVYPLLLFQKVKHQSHDILETAYHKETS